MLQQAYGEDWLSRTQCHEWYQRFKLGRTSIEDDPKSGRPSASMDDHVEKVLAVIRQNRRLNVREVAEAGIWKFMPPDFDRKTENASCCRKICAASLLIHEFLTKHETTVVPQPLYSPDLAPADFLLFPKWKSSLKGRRFQTVETKKIRYGTFAPSRKTRSRMRSRNGKNVGSGVLRVDGSTLKATSLIEL
jgi:hypothetical protein